QTCALPICPAREPCRRDPTLRERHVRRVGKCFEDGTQHGLQRKKLSALLFTEFLQLLRRALVLLVGRLGEGAKRAANRLEVAVSAPTDPQAPQPPGERGAGWHALTRRPDLAALDQSADHVLTEILFDPPDVPGEHATRQRA